MAASQQKRLTEEWSDSRRINSFSGWLLRNWDSPIQETHQGGSAVILNSRMTNEGIVLGDDITLKVIEIRDDKVRMGTELPTGGTVHRAKVHEAIRRVE
jgi:carbon storage regulator